MTTRRIFSMASVAAICLVACLMPVLPPAATLAAQGTPGDLDGDGVADANDCAPADARLSQPHTYYFDEDGDQSGRASEPVTVCAAIPFPGLVARAGDPDDRDNRVTAALAAKGTRLLGLDFSDGAAAGAWRADLARELGAEVTSLSLRWSGLESSPGVYDGPEAAMLPALAGAYAADQFALNLTISPFLQTYWALPADLQAAIHAGTRRLSDPEVIARFNALLTFVHEQLGPVPVAGLQIGDEIDLFIAVRQDVQFWGDFAVLLNAARAHARQLWGSQMLVGTTSTWAGLVEEPVAGLMQYLNGFADVASLTYFPRSAGFEAIDPGQVEGDIQRVIARYYPKPVSFRSIGYPSSAGVGASATRQAQFVEAFFSTWDRYAAVVPYAGFGRLHDPSPARAADEARAAHRSVPVERHATATAFFASLGLRTYVDAGTSKSAYHTLRSAAMNRGWWRVAPPADRSFLLGFIPALWRHTPETSIQDEVLQYNSAVIGATSDLIAYHFDQGIPWPEAYADTFTSPDPPYSANVREVWAKHRGTQPPGVKVAVAITPLGLPRHRMAAYWGVGQGFILDEQFNQIAHGPIIDYEGRILPAPWNSYALNSPQVKSAFLNYARRVIEYFRPTYLITGIEANLAVKNPEAFAQYVELQQYVYTQLRANHAYDNVKIVVSMTAEELVNDEYGRPTLLDALMDQSLQPRNLAAIAALEPYLDIVGLSLYPFKTLHGTYTVPAWFIDNLVAAIRSITDKPLAITETGYPAVSFNVLSLYFPTDAEKQARFLRLLLSDLEKHGNVEFVVNWGVRDITAALDLLRERIAATPGMNQSLADFYRYFEFTGIFDAAGNPRPSAELLASYVRLPLDNLEHFVPPLTLSSPSGSLRATVGISDAGHLVYSVERDSSRVLDESPIGIIANGADLGSGIVNLVASAPIEHVETYPMRGAHPTAVNHYIETTIQARRLGTGDPVSTVVFRVFDDGVAYRHVMPDAARTITGESSAWRLPEGSQFWYQTNTGNYESTYWHGLVGQVDDQIGGPLTFQLPGAAGYALLTEARLRNYSGMTFKATLLSRAIESRFLDDSSWIAAPGSVSPWRVLMVAPTLTALVNSDLVGNLNDAPDAALFPEGAQTRWIRPGRSVWSWWSDFGSAGSFDVQKRYIDDATRLRAEYIVVDAGWEQGFAEPGKDQFVRLSELVAYARTQQRYVGVWVWKDWVELIDPEARRAFLRAVRAAGAVGVKIDNIGARDSESFVNVVRYEDILREAALEQLMVNFHGCNKATGLSRTYPNEITREGFMGLEANAFWEQGLFTPASHNATVPFVRLAAGVGDYTPVTFDPRKLGQTTVAHQLATAGLFTSPVQHFADDTTLLLAQPLVQDVLRLLPTEWDETRVLEPSTIGELALMARRKRDRWYVFAVSGDTAQPRAVPALPLSFLGTGRYDAILIGDQTATSFGRQERTVTRDDTIAVEMLPGGGFTAVFSRAAEPSRRVLQGFSSIPPSFTESGWQQSYGALWAHADMVSHTQQDAVPWVQALTSADYRSYSSYLQAFWNLFVAADSAVIPGRPTYLMLNPIDPVTYTGLAPQLGDGSPLVLPAPWNGYAFNHPDVKTAFLNYVVAGIETLHPTHLALNVEANILLAKSPEKWAAFKELNAHVYTAIKLRYPGITVFSTIQYEHMLGLTEESRSLAIQLRHSYTDVLEAEVKSLLQHSDLVAISSYPFMTENNRYVRPDGRLDQDYYERAFALADALGKPLAFEQAGYISRDLFVASRGVTVPGSEARQQQFVDHLLHDAHVENVEFVINFISTDYGTTYGTSPGAMTWAYTGFWHEDGTPKPALATWTAYRAEATGAAASPGPGTATAGAPTPFEQLAAAVQASAGTGAIENPWPIDAPPSPEVFIRWQQLASFLPSFVVPPADEPTAPWGFPEPYASAARAALTRREAFLSYLEPLFAGVAATGRFPLQLVSAPEMPVYLLGDWVLLAPVIEEGALVREVALPAGARWMNWYTGEVLEGGQTIVAEAPLDRLPIFIRQPSL
jgi:alpha-glucosidase